MKLRGNHDRLPPYSFMSLYNPCFIELFTNGVVMEYVIYHANNGRMDNFARVTGLDELHQWFTNIRVVHGGYMNPANLELQMPDGSFYRAVRV